MGARDISSLETNALGDLIVVNRNCTIDVVPKTKKKLFLERVYLEIISRSDPDDRVETFECRDENGLFDFDIWQGLVEERLKPNETL